MKNSKTFAKLVGTTKTTLMRFWDFCKIVVGKVLSHFGLQKHTALVTGILVFGLLLDTVCLVPAVKSVVYFVLTNLVHLAILCAGVLVAKQVFAFVKTCSAEAKQNEESEKECDRSNTSEK